MKPKEVKMWLTKAVEHPLDVPPVLLEGPPGIGKSAIPKQVAEENNINFVDIRLAQRDVTDLRGIPAVIDGKARWLPPPELPTEGKGILMLDEITSCPPLTQASAYQLTLDRRISEYELPDGYYIVAAGNRLEDRAVVYRMSTALMNRFHHINFEVSKDDWIDWALASGIDANVIGFVAWRPELLSPGFDPASSEKAFATPRCLGKETLVKMWDKTEKPISEIVVGDEIVGYQGAFVKSKVTKIFRTFIQKGMEVSTPKRKVRASLNHHFLTQVGYLTSEELSSKLPVYICSEGDSNVYWKSNEKEKGLVKETQSDNGGQSIPSGYYRWRRKFFLNSQTSLGENLLRATVLYAKLLTFVPGLLSDKRIFGFERQEVWAKTSLAGQVYGITLRQPCSLPNRGIATLSCPKETCCSSNKRVYSRTPQAKIWSDVSSYSEDARIEGGDKTDKLKTTRELVSTRVRDYSEVFYDFTTETGNYVANGFIVHNSWEFSSDILKVAPKSLLPELLEGTVGRGATAEFMAFLKVQTELPDLNKIFQGENFVPKRTDLKYALVSALASRAKGVKQCDRLVLYSEHLPEEFGVLLVAMLVNKDEETMYLVPSFDKWVHKHSDVIISKKMI